MTRAVLRTHIDPPSSTPEAPERAGDGRLGARSAWRSLSTAFAAASLALVASGCPGGGGPLPDGGALDGGSGDGGLGPIVFDDNVEADTTWGPTAPAGDCDVVVKSKPVRVEATLTVLPGTKVCFEANTGLLVEETGALNAVGTASERITFTGKSETQGYWMGIAIRSNNNANVLDGVDVRFAGSSTPFCCGFSEGTETARAALLVGDGSTGALLTLARSRVSDSGGMGLFVFKDSRLPGFVENVFAANAGAPLAVPLVVVNDLDAASVYSGGTSPNGKRIVRVIPYAPTTADVVMKKLDVPYGMSEGFADEDFDVRAALTIQAGVRLEFEAQGGLLVREAGRLVTAGTLAERIILTGRSATPGFWKGVALLGLANALTQTSITHGGSDTTFCCGFFEPNSGGGTGSSTKAALVVGDSGSAASVTLTDVAVTHSKNRGVSKLNGTVVQAGANNLTESNGAVNLGL